MTFTDKDIEFFNTEKTVLLTIHKDNTPIPIPIWGIIHNDAVYMATDSDSKKIGLLEKISSASAFVMEDPPGFPWIRVEGTVEFGSPDDFSEFSGFREVAELIATKYVGEEKAPERFPGNNWKVLKLIPDKVISKVDQDIPESD